jgi:hypothetical protein
MALSLPMEADMVMTMTTMALGSAFLFFFQLGLLSKRGFRSRCLVVLIRPASSRCFSAASGRRKHTVASKVAVRRSFSALGGQ